MEKWRYVYRKIDITMDLISNTPNRQVKVVWWKLQKLHMEKHY